MIISIHAPREGSDENIDRTLAVQSEFLSTLPARGATYQMRETISQVQRISIHAPREGSDATNAAAEVGKVQFLSTLPARGAT